MASEGRQDPERRGRRRWVRGLVRGLAFGAAALGVPATINWWLARRARRLPVSRWGSGDRWRSKRGTVAYERLGEGPPLVLVHSLGVGRSSAEWRRTAEALAPDYEIFAPDLLGWGASEAPATDYGPRLYVELLAEFLARVVRQPAALVAAGTAAAYAVEVAATEPRRVAALGLVVPRGLRVLDRRTQWRQRLTHTLLRLPVFGTAALHAATRRAAIASHLRREVYAAPAAVDDALVDACYQSSHRPGAHRALAAFLAGRLDHRIGDRLGGLEQPVWIAWGRYARDPPVETADLWLRRIPHAELDVFEHCGTLPHAESPDELSKKLSTFLSAAG